MYSDEEPIEFGGAAAKGGIADVKLASLGTGGDEDEKPPLTGCSEMFRRSSCCSKSDFPWRSAGRSSFDRSGRPFRRRATCDQLPRLGAGVR